MTEKLITGHIVHGDGVVQATVDILKKLPYEQVAHVMPHLLSAEPLVENSSLKAAARDEGVGKDTEH